MKFLPVLLITLVLTACTSAQLNQTMGEVNKAIGKDAPLTTTEVANGLKEALVKGISNGSDMASQLDGYFKNPKIKIPFPPEVKKVEDKLRQIGLGGEVDKFVMTLNRGAEDAAKEAKPIFIAAIKQMTIQDAWAILRGSDNAATEYLKRTTSSLLYDKFKPVIQNSLNKVNATKYYGDIVTRYNKIPLVEKVNPDLTDYATNKAMDGLFLLIAEEEKKIRLDPVARTTELLKKVFGAQK
ncbi:DUF4197 domain-containing protein [Parachryseolinea silvisoli]|uniref:DUF4197 domain-containing protein n=1 Tax=Parachryseolinea silvisoli TaxID=2873601 RepID=UPI002265C0CB|nr:DUF4197 domain-containing protein [Parachryseolinea silvisoli]MCD9019974.1 DUF4197 domain-containing protein [Parachryseolinea silvisoli]